MGGHNNLSEDHLKIAVFVDFDNIEIGVRNTLNRNFDIAAVLEAIKERGEIVTKIAYGDWKRAGDYGRAMGQHAIHMVQRNPTPGGDKNGADINLALDALEMAFTRDHINAFVIVGGDSDFIALVEKLKQYDKKVIVVGGRGFTSVILQKNCHEFIAYENLVRSHSSGRRQTGRSRSTSETPVAKAVPLVRRALKILTDREVSPQLGLLKSTLLQLDSTFSERDYGATTFRDFIEKLARTGVVSLKQVDRSLLVELQEDATPESGHDPENGRRRESAKVAETGDTSGNGSARMEEGVQLIRSVFEKAEAPLKWPMYVRGVKQFIKASEPDFDEKEYGFSGLLDALRQTQKAGVLRLERTRQGVLRIFPGEELSRAAPADEVSAEQTAERGVETVPEAEEVVTSRPSKGDANVRQGTASADGTEEAIPKTTRKRKATEKRTIRKTTKKTEKAATKKKTTKKNAARKTTTKAAKKEGSAAE